MLVYFKEPMSFLEIDGYRIYGRKYSYGSFGPADVPMTLYKEHKDSFVEATYTREWLEAKFAKPFPDVSFTLTSLYSLPGNILKELARLVGVKYVSNKSHELTIQERHALRKSIASFLSD